MQRDAYAILVKKAFKIRVPTLVMQVNNEVRHEKLYDESFMGYSARRIVLMTHMDGSGANVLKTMDSIMKDEMLYRRSKIERAAARGGFKGCPQNNGTTPETLTAVTSNGTAKSDKRMIKGAKVLINASETNQAKYCSAANDGAAPIVAASDGRALRGRRDRVARWGSRGRVSPFVGRLHTGCIVQLPSNVSKKSEDKDKADKHNDEDEASNNNNNNVSTDPSSPPNELPQLTKDIIIEDFAKLLEVHQRHYLYKLVPLLCTDINTLSCLQAICSLSNSPFSLDHRREPLVIRTGWQNARSPVRDDVWDYFEPMLTAAERAIPRDVRRFPCGFGIDFDGLLITRPDNCTQINYGYAALLQMRSIITVAAAEEFGHQVDFYRSAHFQQKIAAKIATSVAIEACKAKYFFLGTTKEMDRLTREKVMKIALLRKFSVLEQKSDGTFQFWGY